MTRTIYCRGRVSQPYSYCLRLGNTHIRALLLIGVFENLPQHIDGRVGLDGNARQEAIVVDVPDQGLGVGLVVAGVLGALGVGGEGGLVVEAV